MKQHLLSLVLLLVSRACASAVRTGQQAEFVGWKGDTFDPASTFNESLYKIPPRDAMMATTQPYRLAKRPLAYVWKGLVSREEARHIIEIAAPRMMRSRVGGGHTENAVRTSYGMFIKRNQDAIVSGVQQRIAAWLQLPVSYQEEMQILRYSPGQMYKPHMDANGRMCTVLLYLTDVHKGGETAFPETVDADWYDAAAMPDPTNASACARGHVYAAPRLGDALLFYSQPPGTEALSEEARNKTLVDKYSMHTGCPPADGELKWTATFWVHPRPFRPESYAERGVAPLLDPGDCVNYNAKCEGWAAAGECDKNKAYMRGGYGSPGQCRLACKECMPCPVGNQTCLDEARQAQGYLPNLTAELKQLFRADE